MPKTFEAHLIHSRYYLTVLQRASGLWERGGAETREHVILYKDWANIRAGQSWAETNLKLDRKAAQLCCDYALAVKAMGVVRETNSRLIAQWYKTALEAVRNMQQPEIEVLCLFYLGDVYLSLGEPQKRTECYEKALLISRKIRDRRFEGFCLQMMASDNKDTGQVKEAIDLYKKAMEITYKANILKSDPYIMRGIGDAKLHLGHINEAAKLPEQALSSVEASGDKTMLCIYLMGLGEFYAEIGENHRAITYGEQALNICRDIESPLLEMGAIYYLKTVQIKVLCFQQFQHLATYLKKLFFGLTEILAEKAQKIEIFRAGNYAQSSYYLHQRMRREFWYMCRFIHRIADGAFRAQVEQLAASNQQEVSKRASFLIAYLENPENGERTRKDFYFECLHTKYSELSG